MRKSCLVALLFLFGLSVPPGSALAHFGMAIPSASVVGIKRDAAIHLEFSFSHPMEMIGMPLEKPASARVFFDGMVEDLGALLQPVQVMGHQAWKAGYRLKRPGVYQFVMEPRPYWEEAEDCFIIHYVKTCVAAFGGSEGWEEPLSLKTEIVPLTRPFGNYAGNVFQGRVLLDGQPVPHALVEVEYYNRNGEYAAPNSYMAAQTIRADAGGVFTYGVPFAGWWGFAALNTASEKIERDGVSKDVELGAVIWVEFVAPVKN